MEEWIQVISLQVNNGVQCEELENIVGHVVFWIKIKRTETAAQSGRFLWMSMGDSGPTNRGMVSRYEKKLVEV